MRSPHAFIVLSFLLITTPTYAQAVHQYGYEEVDYGFYPDEMPKAYDRVQTWLQNAQVEIDKIMEAKHPHIIAWREAIMAVPMDDDRQMLNRVNAITNSYVPYVTDYDGDDWASPIGTLLRGGDCEDIALLKAVALHMKGWDATGGTGTHLLVGLLFYGNKNVPHAALEVDTSDGKHYVMNNLQSDVVTFDDMNLKMKPLYMIDATGVTGFVKSRHSLASLAASAGARDGETLPIEWDETSSR